MDKDIQAVCEGLDRLGELIVSSFPHSTDQPFTDYWSWQVPSINRRDLSEMAKSIADDLRVAYPDTFPSELEPFIAPIHSRISFLHSTTLPHAYAGNIMAFSALIESLRFFRKTLLPSVDWSAVPTKTLMPAPLVRRITAAKGRVEDLEGAIPELAKKVDAINAAHLVADNLEVDLQALTEARRAVEQTVGDVNMHRDKAENLAGQLASALHTTEERIEKTWESVRRKSEAAMEDADSKAKIAVQKMEAHEESAKKLIAQCEAAYHIATTTGLAGAFDQRAASLAWSMRGWVAGLACALAAGSWIGSSRLATLANVLAQPATNWPVITSNVVLSILGVGAPLWFSWLATKQIGQRFRLSEDYAFKASVAKAYEGYRKEAAVLDPDFQATLFRSALTRLDEAPLRLVETEHHASPLAELINSDIAKSAIKIAPELPSKIMDLIKETVHQTKSLKREFKDDIESGKEIILPESRT